MALTSQQAIDLLHRQLESWEQARSNYEALKGVETKEFSFGSFPIRVQFNPARIQSSAAKVDTKSIQERKCFLCPANLPPVQQSIPFGTDYQVLVNPFPIFPQHFTIPTLQHVDQLILNRYGDMLDLAECLDRFVIFYNGPKCGASAPDHAHFQAGNKGFLPLEEDIKSINKSIVHKTEGLTVYSVTDYFRNSFLLEATNKDEAISFFHRLYALLDIKDAEKEPMLNILSWYDGNKWFSYILPREVHRPACFFAEGIDNMLISPASVDIGGVFITPLEKDFRKITANDIKAILEEICISDDRMQLILNEIAKL